MKKLLTMLEREYENLAHPGGAPPAKLAELRRVNYVTDLITRGVIVKVKGPRHPDVGVVVMDDGGVGTGVVFHEPAGVFPSEELVAKLMLVT